MINAIDGMYSKLPAEDDWNKLKNKVHLVGSYYANCMGILCVQYAGLWYSLVVFTHCGCERVKESEITKCIIVPDPDSRQSIDDGWECLIDTLSYRTGFRACVGRRSGLILTFLQVRRDLIRGNACIRYKIRLLPVSSDLKVDRSLTF